MWNVCHPQRIYIVAVTSGQKRAHHTLWQLEFLTLSLVRAILLLSLGYQYQGLFK